MCIHESRDFAPLETLQIPRLSCNWVKISSGDIAKVANMCKIKDNYCYVNYTAVLLTLNLLKSLLTFGVQSSGNRLELQSPKVKIHLKMFDIKLEPFIDL